MASIRWAELCEHIIVDAGGKVSVIGMFDMIAAGGFPAQHPDLWVVVKFEGMPGEKARVEIDFVDPDGQPFRHAGPIEGIISPGGGALLAARIFRPTFQKPGPYQVRIRQAVGPATNLPLTITQTPAEPQRQG